MGWDAPIIFFFFFFRSFYGPLFLPSFPPCLSAAASLSVAQTFAKSRTHKQNRVVISRQGYVLV